jgi:TolB-like protein
MSIDVFISYRRTDEPWARRLYGLLNERGVAAWYDAHVAAGEDWRAATARALEAAPIFLLLYSKAASESDDITKELAAATFSKKQVIPVRLENIPPSGPFLYELASRNWIDAFTDTEAKLADLADRIAAQVKAAPATTQDPSPARPPWGDPAALAKARAASQASGRRRTLVAGAFAAGALLLAAAIWGGMALLRPAPPAKPGELTAFFGFLADPADPTASAIAKAATDETFQTMNAYRLETASRTRTQSVALADQLARARELGASYALGGEVRSEGAKVTLAMRLDDVETERTLWEGTVYGVPSESVSLPVLTASTAVTNLL